MGNIDVFVGFVAGLAIGGIAGVFIFSLFVYLIIRLEEKFI